ncbi:hypothetical protein [Moraxella sp. ZY210820]|uniref:hypothetical protein n=1 Tax=unclassified Moraxella TaxID=2685852 RepID=UPI00272FD0F8|nr:hypothetical protein [Moraxella sp. ZY210820]WLF84501.1 hypothetical protein LU301_03225 [Moraxella sp. ZY210820]
MIIDIPPMYEQYIQQLANERGLSVSEYVVELLPKPYEPNAQTVADLKTAMAERETAIAYHSVDDAMQALQQAIHG